MEDIKEYKRGESILVGDKEGMVLRTSGKDGLIVVGLGEQLTLIPGKITSPKLDAKNIAQVIIKRLSHLVGESEILDEIKDEAKELIEDILGELR